MYEFWYDYVKPKEGQNPKLCYIYTDRFLIYLKSEEIYADIPKDFIVIFGTSNYGLDR